MMTSRERAGAAIRRAIMAWDGNPATISGNLIYKITSEVSDAITEHARALLADDEATIEAIVNAFCQAAMDRSLSDFRDGERDMAIAGGRAALAALRRKALGE